MQADLGMMDEWFFLVHLFFFGWGATASKTSIQTQKKHSLSGIYLEIKLSLSSSSVCSEDLKISQFICRMVAHEVRRQKGDVMKYELGRC